MQFPGGLLGQRFGARRVFAVIGVDRLSSPLLVVPLAPLCSRERRCSRRCLGAQLMLGAGAGADLPAHHRSLRGVVQAETLAAGAGL